MTSDLGPLTEPLRAELGDLQSDVASMTGQITKGLAQAIVEGEELEGLLQSLILKQSNQALDSAMNDAYGLIGSLGEGLVNAALGGITGQSTGGTANIFNVNVATPDATSFRNSETQLAASLSRAVSRGQRGL